MSPQAAVAELPAQRVSFSELSTYLRCPRSHRFKYIDHLEPAHRPGVLVFGGAVHEALAVFYSAFRDGRPEPPVKQLQEAFSESWLRELNQPVPVLLDGQDAESLMTAGQIMLAMFVEKVARPHRVLAVEERFTVDIYDPATGEVLPEQLVGVIDAVTEDEAGRIHLLEHKTAARRWPETRLANDLQISAYHFAAGELGLADAQVDVQVLLKLKKPALEIYSPPRTKRDHLDFLAVAAGVLKAINAGADHPIRDWHCKSCPFAARCTLG